MKVIDKLIKRKDRQIKMSKQKINIDELMIEELEKEYINELRKNGSEKIIEIYILKGYILIENNYILIKDNILIDYSYDTFEFYIIENEKVRGTHGTLFNDLKERYENSKVILKRNNIRNNIINYIIQS